MGGYCRRVLVISMGVAGRRASGMAGDQSAMNGIRVSGDVRVARAGSKIDLE
jgi:hypothetical protein